ncbi:MAG: NUDIX domain-containing protein [Arcobacteraceae bacterium]
MKETFRFTNLRLITDNYSGIIIDNTTIPDVLEEFEEELIQIIENLEDKRLLWVKVPINRSDLIPILTKYDFIFHHCNENDITLLKKLVFNPIIPTARNHTLGVGVVVINEKNELLVIKERINPHYKLPGGHIDDDENISTAVVREVKEETGIDVEFSSIIALGHFKPLQFGESNLYIGCRAKALSDEVDIIDEIEILEARWMDLDLFLNSDEIYEFNKKIVLKAIQNDGFRHDHLDIFKGKSIDYELFF